MGFKQYKTIQNKFNDKIILFKKTRCLDNGVDKGLKDWQIAKKDYIIIWYLLKWDYMIRSDLRLILYISHNWKTYNWVIWLCYYTFSIIKF